MSKKAPKTEEEIRVDVERQQQDRFIAAIREVEQSHGYKLDPILHYSVRGILPQITVVKKEQSTALDITEPEETVKEEEDVV